MRVVVDGNFVALLGLCWVAAIIIALSLVCIEFRCWPWQLFGAVNE